MYVPGCFHSRTNKVNLVIGVIIVNYINCKNQFSLDQANCKKFVSRKRIARHEIPQGNERNRSLAALWCPISGWIWMIQNNVLFIYSTYVLYPTLLTPSTNKQFRIKLPSKLLIERQQLLSILSSQGDWLPVLCSHSTPSLGQIGDGRVCRVDLLKSCGFM